MDLIDVPQTTKLLLTLAQSVMPVLLLSVPALTYMNYINGKLEKIPGAASIVLPNSVAPKRAAPCHYSADGLVPPPPPIVQ